MNAVGGAAFGVYLIHYSYAWREKLWEMLLGALPAGGTPALSLLLAALLVYAACALLDLARRSALEPLYMRLIDRLPPVRREKGARGAMTGKLPRGNACLPRRREGKGKNYAKDRAARPKGGRATWSFCASSPCSWW